MSPLTSLSDKAYTSMRKAMVKEVYNSETMSIKDVAERHRVSPSTLWGWCHADLGPSQIKWLVNRCNSLRAKRAKAQNKTRCTDEPVIQPPVVGYLSCGARKHVPNVMIHLDSAGKFIKYEVHGAATVQVYALTK